MRTLVLVSSSLVLAASAIGACGADVQSTSAATGSVSGSGGSATATGSTTASSTTTASSGAGQGGAMPEGGPLGQFDCHGCACDGATHYCKVTEGGAAPKTPPSPGCPDVDAGSPNGCVPLPDACFPSPSCGCLDLQPGPCNCMNEGPGLAVTCSLP